jgi:hypothetical protein
MYKMYCKKSGVLLLLLLILSTSCTPHRFYVYGKPRTVIYDGNRQLAVVGENGEAEIELERDSPYKPLLFATDPDTQKTVPFALDYKNTNRSGTWLGVAIPMALPTCVISIVVYALKCDSPEEIDFDYLDYQHTNNDLIK